MGLLLAVAITFCLASMVALTLLVPSRDTYPPNGGYLPISQPVGGR